MIKMDKNNRWIGCRVKEDLFAAVFNAPFKDIAASLLDQVYDKSK